MMSGRSVLVVSLASALAGATCRAPAPASGQAEHGHDHASADHVHETTADHGHDHGHESAAIGITRFGDHVEMFAEHAPAVRGSPVELLVHVTVLEGFSPLTSARVTLELEGPVQVATTVETPERPGIYRVAITPPRAGNYRGRLRVAGETLTDVVDGFAIAVHEAASDVPHPVSAAADDAITFLKEQQWQVPFATAMAVSRSITRTAEVPGEVSTPPGGRARVGAPVAGRVVASDRGLPRPGQAVVRGELLASLALAPAAPETAARADLAVVEARARVDAATIALDRARRLLAERAVAPAVVEQAQRELEVATQAVEASRRARRMLGGAAAGRGSGSYRVTSPIDGVIVAVTTTLGQSVDAGQSLFDVVDLRQLWIHARVPEHSAARLQRDGDASYRVAGLDTWRGLDVNGDDANASVVDVAPVVDPVTRTVDVVYALHDPDPALRVGAAVQVAIPIGDMFEGVVIPRTAVFDDDGRTLVYVQLTGESFEERAVTLGPVAGEWVGVMSGLRPSERIVTRGGNVLRLVARASNAPAHGHVH